MLRNILCVVCFSIMFDMLFLEGENFYDAWRSLDHIDWDFYS